MVINASGIVRGRVHTTATATTQWSNVCACASYRLATKRRPKDRPKYFLNIALFVGHRHPINNIVLVIYIFVCVLACKRELTEIRVKIFFCLLLVADLSVLLAFSAPVCPRFVVWKRFSHLVKDLVQAV